MNLAFLSRFRKSSRVNMVFGFIRAMKKHPIFRKARFDVYSSGFHPKKVVIVLGQMHTVWSGNISNRQRKKIVACQARLSSYYAYFQMLHGVSRFGGEGVYEGLDIVHVEASLRSVYDQVSKTVSLNPPVALEKVYDISQQVFSLLGKQWQEVLRDREMKKIQHLAAAVSGQSFYHYLSQGKAESYPIEAEVAYQKVLQGINHLSDQIAQLEKKPEFRYVQQRGGKVKTEQESQVVGQYNLLVKEFNRLIGSDIREQATFDILKQKAEEEDVVIFAMGVAHRKNYLRLVNEALKKTDIAFVFVTAPELLINWWIALGVPMLILVILLLLNSLF